jgi:thioredoxin-related protein
MSKSGIVPITLLSFLTLSNSALVAQGKDSLHVRYVAVAEFDSTRNPAKDVDDAVVEAKKTGMRILLDVGGNWCKWCHYLDSFWEKNKDVAGFLHEKFIYVKVNYSKGNENKDFLSKYPKIPGYPHFFVLNSDGTLLWSQNTGELESGQGHDHDKVLAFLKKWAP